MPRREPDASYISDGECLVELWFKELVCACTEDDKVTLSHLSRDGDALIVFVRRPDDTYQKIEIKSKPTEKKWQEYLVDQVVDNILEH